MDETEAIKLARAGDKEAFGHLVELHQKTVYNIALRMVHSREVAMDLAQEAFLEAFAHMDRFDTSKPFGPWVYRIVHNRALNYVKRSGHRSAPRLSGDDVLARSKASDSHDAAGARLDREQLKNHLQVEVEKLPAKIKGAFVLRYLEDKSVKDVAEILAVPVNTVKTHLFRAREHLRQKLRWWFDE